MKKFDVEEENEPKARLQMRICKIHRGAYGGRIWERCRFAVSRCFAKKLK